MHFRIADTFTASLARLTGDEQKAVKTTAFDLQLNPAAPGLSFHRLDRVRDRHFWSVRVNDDIRLIVHRTESSLLLCYVDHHDPAYRWAERRRLETHPTTGAAQFVEIREQVREIAAPQYVATAPAAPAAKPLFADLSDEVLLGYGVPVEWLPDVRGATEDTLLTLAEHLPAEAAEALLELATGGTPRAAAVAAPETSPFDHPDAQRRFRAMEGAAALEQALAYPWDRWMVFLHPAQRELVERDYNGPARVSGSAGTGKTIVALHRAVHLARRYPDARVLLATFSDTLARALHGRLRRLIASEPQLAERIEVQAKDAIGLRLYERRFGPARFATREAIQDLLAAAVAQAGGSRFSPGFLFGEWREVVDAWQLDTWEAYRDVRRLGRKTRLAEAQRAALWALFSQVRAGLDALGLVTHAGVFTRLAADLAGQPPPFDFAVVDEAQDVSIAQLRFLAALGGDRPNALFFAGDLGQRIFQQPFSWKALGVDVRGRARTLHVNYRASHQIRSQADRLLGAEVADVDGNVESRRSTVSVFNGPAPTVRSFASEDAEIAAVGAWLAARAAEGMAPHELGVFVRTAAQWDRATAAVARAGLSAALLDEHLDTRPGAVCVGTMHLAKGLEFRAVAVMACDDAVIPLQERIEAVTDDADLQEVYDTERHLLYVACTRARDCLLVSGFEPASEFLDDLLAAG